MIGSWAQAMGEACSLVAARPSSTENQNWSFCGFGAASTPSPILPFVSTETVPISVSIVSLPCEVRMDPCLRRPGKRAGGVAMNQEIFGSVATPAGLLATAPRAARTASCELRQASRSDH